MAASAERRPPSSRPSPSPTSDGEGEHHQPAARTSAMFGSSAWSRSSAATTRASNCVQQRLRSSAIAADARAGRPVTAIRGHRVEGVGDEDDARAERDLLAGEAERVAGAVPPLVVVQDPAIDRRDAQPLEQARAEHGVLAHHPQLVRIELARLLQDAVGDRDLAQVVQQARQAHLLDHLDVEAHRCARSPRPGAKPSASERRRRCPWRRRPGSGPRRRATGRGARPPRPARPACTSERPTGCRCTSGSCRGSWPSRARRRRRRRAPRGRGACSGNTARPTLTVTGSPCGNSVAASRPCTRSNMVSAALAVCPGRSTANSSPPMR